MSSASPPKARPKATKTVASQRSTKAKTPATPFSFENVAELRERLGGVPLSRILLDPPPGTATVKDVLRHVDGDAKRLVELVEGTLVEKAMGFDEAGLATRLAAFMWPIILKNRLGRLVGADGTIRMRGGNVRMPDLGFYSRERLKSRPKGNPVPPMAPEIAVEVVSKGNTKKEIARKRKECFETGSVYVWVIDGKKKTVAVYTEPKKPLRTLTIDDTLDAPNVLPGFSLSVEHLFDEDA